MAPIRVGLMGYGFSTNCFHVPYILPNPDLDIYAFLQRKEPPKDKSIIGQVTEFENHYDVDDPPWLRANPNPGPGDGMLFGLGTHSIDQTLLLFGPPQSVLATTRTLKAGSKADDTFVVLLQYGGEQKDLLVLVKTTIVSPVPGHKQPKYVIRGREGAFFKSGEDVQVDQFYGGVKVEDPGFGVEPATYHGYLCTTERSPIGKHDGTYASEKGSCRDYYIDVVAAIKGERKVAVRPEESRDGLRIIEAAVQSAEAGVAVALHL